MRTVAALYVEPDGVYSGLEGVDGWIEARDARLYRGPHPVVAHPPCLRWCIMANCQRKRDGKDGGCFESAIAAVRDYGGVLEHPAHSLAWRWFGMCPPPGCGGWVNADWLGGWTCCVDQGHYGHAYSKPTWLYAVGCDLPSLEWGRSDRPRTVADVPGKGRNHEARSRTPEPFRDILLSMARSVNGANLR